ncbi:MULTISPECIES: MucB/RseB C-terminal domain-containing protein [unclassified Iodobacter]|uniref:MucB/RseB C-terminal domain-containing protein n=1 Tax=unclassified Iodobacter TaxID=235634 RepID=UPI0025CC9A30|nr:MULTISPECIES: MucB/RseB C-terminal domain-containing protein [unclassified Iodobacter]MDW5415912.1 MucB/RseB C-terminal domain-containing protein [Iodobacter sp. CM08]
MSDLLDRLKPLVLCVSLFLPVSAWAASELNNADAAVLLNRMVAAAKQADFQGTFTHQHGDATETFRIVHVGSEPLEIERRESLDGPRREYVRKGDQISIYLPSKRPVSLDRRFSSKLFPQHLPETAEAVLLNYKLKKLGMERVAGLNAQVLELEPRDVFRFPMRLWMHTESGLILKSERLGPYSQPVELFVFSNLVLGKIDRALLSPVNPLRAVVMESNQGVASSPVEPSWKIEHLPRGFRFLKSIQRSLIGKEMPVVQHLYSDGLVTVSVFLEPAIAEVKEGASHQSAMHMFVRQIDGKMVTVLGEVPADTVKAFALAFNPQK